MTTSDYFQLLAPRTVNLFTLNLTFRAAHCQSLHAHFQIVSPLLHTASCCVYCFKSQKQKKVEEKWPQTRFIFSITSIVSTSRRFREPSGRQTLFLRGSGNRFSSTVDRVCPASPINTLDSAPVVFRCAAQTLGLETFFFFCCSTLFLQLARLLQTNGMCVCSGFCCFCCSRPFGYLYLQWSPRFLQTFRPKS